MDFSVIILYNEVNPFKLVLFPFSCSQSPRTVYSLFLVLYFELSTRMLIYSYIYFRYDIALMS